MDWPAAHRSTRSRASGNTGLAFRRDVTLPGGEFAQFHVLYLGDQFTAEEQRDDLAAIHRILNSARPIAR